MRLRRSPVVAREPARWHRERVILAAGVLVFLTVGVVLTWVALAARDPAPSGECPPGATARPSDSEGLRAALTTARPGDVIRLDEKGVYSGPFEIEVEATEDEPVWLCGQGSVLVGESITSGNVLTVRRSAWVHVTGVFVESGTRGVVVDRSDHVSFTDGGVRGTGQEAVHLLRGTTDSLIARNIIEDTGLRRPQWGEGVYVGTSPPNEERMNAGESDRSDGNRIADNEFRRTSAECVDAKTGTRGGVIEGNVCDLSEIGRFDTGQYTTRNGFVIRGNDWRVTGNALTWPGPGAADGFITDGIRVHVGEGRGEGNVIEGNRLGGTDVRADPSFGNRVNGNAP